MSGAVAEATKENFRDLVGTGTVLVDVWGPQCRPCIALMPHVERIAAERPELKVVKLDSSQNRRLCMELRLMGLPVFLLFRDGKEIARFASPEMTDLDLERWLDKTLKEVSRPSC
ncbi:MAG TPA: thioredoxin family protein [Gemmatimonadales bacterium]|nr:thioredoxin family protein [Gemmatimonadales bacterium]